MSLLFLGSHIVEIGCELLFALCGESSNSLWVQIATRRPAYAYSIMWNRSLTILCLFICVFARLVHSQSADTSSHQCANGDGSGPAQECLAVPPSDQMSPQPSQESVKFPSDAPETFDSDHIIQVRRYRELIVFEGNKFCDLVHEKWQELGFPNTTTPIAERGFKERPHIQLQVAFDCQHAFERDNLGTGNYLVSWYGVRLTARRLGRISLNVTCRDHPKNQDLLLPWVLGYFPASDALTEQTVPILSEEEACWVSHKLPLQYMKEDLLYEMRRMAIAQVGRIPNHASFSFLDQKPYDKDQLQLAIPDQPIVPEVELDDAVIHLRGGDLLAYGYHKYSYYRFRDFTSVIAPNVTSIGIVTAPYKSKTIKQRKPDTGEKHSQRTEVLATTLQNYLQERFPKARVSIRNEDSMAVSYARMIMAQQCIMSILSTFSIFPTLTTFGEGYMVPPLEKLGRRASFNFLLFPRVDEMYEHVSFIKGERKVATSVAKEWDENEEKILNWFMS